MKGQFKIIVNKEQELLVNQVNSINQYVHININLFFFPQILVLFFQNEALLQSEIAADINDFSPCQLKYFLDSIKYEH